VVDASRGAAAIADGSDHGLTPPAAPSAASAPLARKDRLVSTGGVNTAAKR